LLWENRVDELARHVGEPEVATVVVVGKSFVIEPEEVQDGGVPSSKR